MSPLQAICMLLPADRIHQHQHDTYIDQGDHKKDRGKVRRQDALPDGHDQDQKGNHAHSAADSTAKLLGIIFTLFFLTGRVVARDQIRSVSRKQDDADHSKEDGHSPEDPVRPLMDIFQRHTHSPKNRLLCRSSKAQCQANFYFKFFIPYCN